MDTPKVRRIDFSPDEYLAAIAGMRPEDQGVYWLICSLIYSKGRPIRDDDERLRALCGTRKDHLRRILDRLETSAKVMRKCGELDVKRCRTELELASNRLRTARENGAKGGRPNGLAKPDGYFPANLSSLSPSTIIKNQESSKEDSSRLVPQQMAAIWKAECEGRLRSPAKIDGARATAARARWADSFGHDLERWRAHVCAILAVPFCCGENDRGWKADFDWALKPKTILAIAEGKYERDEAGLQRFNGHGRRYESFSERIAREGESATLRHIAELEARDRGRDSGPLGAVDDDV